MLRRAVPPSFALLAGVVFAAASVVGTGCGARDVESPGEGEGEGSVVVGEGEGEGSVVVGEGEGEGEGSVVGEGEGEGSVVGEGEGEGVPSTDCALAPACDAAAPVVTARDWNHATSSLTSLGGARHRGRDLLLVPGQEQWALAKFSYSALDTDLTDEDVDVFLLRDCGGTWESLGTMRTTRSGDHATVYGVEDHGGHVYLPIPGAPLGLGRHRVHFVVAGDGSSTDQFIEVVAPTQAYVVTDVDGTLTTTENEEFTALLTGNLPDARPHAAEALTALARAGAVPVYLTARPEWLMPRTREFLDTNGFPAGIVHTSLTLTGATGNAAQDFKTGELAAMTSTIGTPLYGFGNKDSDSGAYESAQIPLDHRYFVEFSDARGGMRIDDWADVTALAADVDATCPAF